MHRQQWLRLRLIGRRIRIDAARLALRRLRVVALWRRHRWHRCGIERGKAQLLRQCRERLIARVDVRRAGRIDSGLPLTIRVDLFLLGGNRLVAGFLLNARGFACRVRLRA